MQFTYERLQNRGTFLGYDNPSSWSSSSFYVAITVPPNPPRVATYGTDDLGHADIVYRGYGIFVSYS